MKENHKHYRKTPPYMTKTGVQIGLLYQEPFEVVVDDDAFNVQGAYLRRFGTKRKQEFHPGDFAVCVVSAIIFIAILLMEILHVL